MAVNPAQQLSQSIVLEIFTVHCVVGSLLHNGWQRNVFFLCAAL